MVRIGYVNYSGKEDGNDNNEKCNDLSSEKDAAMMMNIMTIFGGPDVGFNTNPETEKMDCFMVVKGEKIVCIAQGGECRYNDKYYFPGLNDIKSWTTPIIDGDCPDRCGYKVLVCDNHDKKCEGSITYYPQYNKFRGQYVRYCRNLDKYVNQSVDDNENVRKGEEEIDGTDRRKLSKRDMKLSNGDMKIGITHEKGKNGKDHYVYY